MAKKAESKTKKKRDAPKKGGMQVVRIGDPAKPSAGRIEVKIGRDIKLVVEESAIRDAIGTLKEAFNAIANKVRPMNDDQLKEFIKEKKCERDDKNDAENEDKK